MTPHQTGYLLEVFHELKSDDFSEKEVSRAQLLKQSSQL